MWVQKLLIGKTNQLKLKWKRKLINLKYSINPVEDYKRLSIGRKLYIEKRATKQGVSLEKYLEEKYND